jgi:hypothetical protein
VMEYRIDFFDVDGLLMRELGISEAEVYSVVVSPNSYFDFRPDFNYCLGFSSKRKFIQVAFVYSQNPNFDLRLTSRFTL